MAGTPGADGTGKRGGLDWQHNILTLIDLRSFSNIWYWIVVAVMWSSLSHYVMGVPYDMVTRALRHGGAAQTDLEALVQVQVNRRVQIAALTGPWLVALASAGLTVLALLGFAYGIQFGQALFFLLAPASLTVVMGGMAARRLEAEPLEGEALCAYLTRLRFYVRLLATLSIIVTALWAAWHLMSVSALRG